MICTQSMGLNRLCGHILIKAVIKGFNMISYLVFS